MKSLLHRFLLLNVSMLFVLMLSACTVIAEPPLIRNFDECVAAGNKVLRSFPARCISGSGETFVDKAAVGDLPMLEEPSVRKKMCVDHCGDGECAEMVCMAEGCPCAENSVSCPQDCK